MMKLPFSAKTVLYTAFCVAVLQSSANAKTMYKWVDEHGKVSFSDQVPAGKAGLGHAELDKNANVVKIAEKAKTRAELELEKRLILLRKQQEQLLIQQKANDKKLLSRFLNVEAMDATKKLKMQSLADQERETLETLKQLEEDLSAKQREAANYELKNTKVPRGILNQIEDTQKKIAATKRDYQDLQEKKVAVEKRFAVDRERYLFLTQSKTRSGSNASAAEKSEMPVSQPGLFSCESNAECDKAWVIAKEFVEKNSTAKIEVDSDTLYMSKEPVSDADVNLSVSKMVAEGKQSEIFLDIRCTSSIAGKTLCASAKVQDINVRFNDYIKTKLAAAPAPVPAAPKTPAPTVPKK